MAHFAKLDNDNLVIAVHTVNNNVILNSNNEEIEQKGVDFLAGLHDHNNWKQCSYNGTIRKNYPLKGFKYDEQKDAFIPPKPFNSFILNEDTCLWEAPVQQPDYTSPNIGYSWNEAVQMWDEINLHI